MLIKNEDNRITVAQKSSQDLTKYYVASPIEEQIINTANETNSLAVINGAYYEPKDNLDYLAERAERDRLSVNMGLQMQINELELKRIRAFIEPGIKDENSGETWLAYRTAQIEELRKQMT